MTSSMKALAGTSLAGHTSRNTTSSQNSRNSRTLASTSPKFTTTFRQRRIIPRRPNGKKVRSSIRIETVAVVELQRGVLLFLAHKAIAGHQHLDLAAHEAAEC